MSTQKIFVNVKGCNVWNICKCLKLLKLIQFNWNTKNIFSYTEMISCADQKEKKIPKNEFWCHDSICGKKKS